MCAAWYANDGSQGTNARHPIAIAPSTRAADRRVDRDRSRSARSTNGGRDEVQRPVVREHKRGGDERDPDEPPHRVVFERLGHEKVGRQCQRNDERVHPGLGRVAQCPRVQGQQHDGEPPDGPAAEALAGEPDERQRREGAHARERPHRGVALAEHRHPGVEEPVIERRMAVVTQRLGDVADRQPGDVHRQCFVEPEVRLGPEAQDEPDSGGGADGDPSREQPPLTGFVGGGHRRLGTRRRGLGVRDRHGPQR